MFRTMGWWVGGVYGLVALNTDVIVDDVRMSVGEMYVLPFECVFIWNNNSNTVKLSTYTPMWHHYIIFLTEDMSSTKYWCT